MSELERLQASCFFEIANCDSLQKLDLIKSAVFGKNGKITEIMKRLRNLEDNQKRQLGSEINTLKNNITEKWNEKFHELEMKELDKKLSSEFVDVS
ncbi:MAG: hypothetical protein LBF44_01655, partial [Holosporaceae bacterium]|nr:hypothetical protein [Holosporaceae bacterium]